MVPGILAGGRSSNISAEDKGGGGGGVLSNPNSTDTLNIKGVSKVQEFCEITLATIFFKMYLLH